jgi:branched-chain amino acid transport system permease protein
VNDWTAFVIFIGGIGGIGTIEGPIIGTVLYFVLREFLADLGSLYLMILGGLAIVVMLFSPKGKWGATSRTGSISRCFQRPTTSILTTTEV